MKLNLYGSTGEIGKKTLKIIYKNFPELKVNLLCANSNDKLLFKQIKKYKPKFVFLNDVRSSSRLKSRLQLNVKVLDRYALDLYLKNSKSDYSILAISGYKSLYYLEQIINNTTNLGIVSKEAIVSAGHIFKKKKYFKKTNIFPLDSEHFSLYQYLNSLKNKDVINNIGITASGGPFYKKNFKTLNNITFNQAIKHPKWKMGYKNSIDSATLVNKCLEVIEAHYLFNIPYDKINIFIHPEAIVHSLVNKKNYVTDLNLFKNDMSIPIINFLSIKNNKIHNLDKNLTLPKLTNLKFLEVSNTSFPIYRYFINLNKKNPSNIIKFNVGNELAVELFKNKKIKYTDIYKIIKKVGSLNLNYPLNNIKDIIKYHEIIEKKSKLILKHLY